MKRRTFLQTCAVAPAGLLGLGKSQPAFRPPARWEWEVGEWRRLAGYRVPIRDWTATVEILPAEVPALLRGVLRLNKAAFCGVSPGCLQLTWLATHSVGDGLAECSVSLEEHRTPREYVAINVEGQTVKYSVFRRANFHDLFRGGNDMWFPVYGNERRENDDVESV